MNNLSIYVLCTIGNISWKLERGLITFLSFIEKWRQKVLANFEALWNNICYYLTCFLFNICFEVWQKSCPPSNQLLNNYEKLFKDEFSSVLMVLIWLGVLQIQVIKYANFEKTNDRNYDFADIAVYFTGIPL